MNKTKNVLKYNEFLQMGKLIKKQKEEPNKESVKYKFDDNDEEYSKILKLKKLFEKSKYFHEVAEREIFLITNEIKRIKKLKKVEKNNNDEMKGLKKVLAEEKIFKKKYAKEMNDYDYEIRKIEKKNEILKKIGKKEYIKKPQKEPKKDGLLNNSDILKILKPYDKIYNEIYEILKKIGYGGRVSFLENFKQNIKSADIQYMQTIIKTYKQDITDLLISLKDVYYKYLDIAVKKGVSEKQIKKILDKYENYLIIN